MRIWNEVLASMQRHADRPAFIDPEGANLTYVGLNQWVEEVSKGLERAQLTSDHCIGILALKNQEVVAVMLACLKLGIPYVPLDLESPLSRLNNIIKDGGITHIICDDVGAESCDGLTKDSRAFWSGHELNLFATREDRPHGEAETAFILYTSGSTGIPKGVMISHENAMAFVLWGMQEFGYGPEDIITSIAPLHFDLSVLDIFGGLLSGASVVLFDQRVIKNPRYLTQSISTLDVSVIYTTPTMLSLMMGFGKWARFESPALRMILFAGEVMPMDTLRALMGLFPDTDMYNLYGPTETNVVTYYEVEKSRLEHMTGVPIGRSCPYAELRTDENTGELFVAGASVALGYVGGRNSERFFLNADERWYRTGDIVDLDEEGSYLFLGRNDRMVKKKGYRIELDEIESGARRTGMVDQVACVSLPEGQGTSICMYVRALSANEWTEMGFREVLATQLPAYMLPDRIIVTKELPYTSNHKVDYVKLKSLAHVRT